MLDKQDLKAIRGVVRAEFARLAEALLRGEGDPTDVGYALRTAFRRDHYGWIDPGEDDLEFQYGPVPTDRSGG